MQQPFDTAGIPAGCPAHGNVPLYGTDFGSDPESTYARLRALGASAPVDIAPDVEVGDEDQHPDGHGNSKPEGEAGQPRQAILAASLPAHRRSVIRSIGIRNRSLRSGNARGVRAASP